MCTCPENKVMSKNVTSLNMRQKFWKWLPIVKQSQYSSIGIIFCAWIQSRGHNKIGIVAICGGAQYGYIMYGLMPFYTMVHRWHTTTTLTKCVVVWCCGCCFEYPQQYLLTKCVCCGYSKQHPQHHTTTHFVKMCCCGYSKQHPQHHTTTHFVNVVVVCHLWTIVVLC